MGRASLVLRAVRALDRFSLRDAPASSGRSPRADRRQLTELRVPHSTAGRSPGPPGPGRPRPPAVGNASAATTAHGAGPGCPPPGGPSRSGIGGIGPGPAIAISGADPIPTTTDSPGLRLSLSTMAPPGCARRESRVADRRFRFSHPPRLPGTPDRRSSPSSPAHDTAPTEAASNAPIDAGHKLRATPGSPPTRTIPPGSPKINKKDLRNRWRDPADYSIRGGGEPTKPRARNP